MGPADWAGIPIDGTTGDINWKVRSCWKIAEFLPPAVRPSLILYAGDLLLGPQRELGKQCLTAGPDLEPAVEEADGCEDDDEDMCREGDGDDRDRDVGADMVDDGEAAAAATAVAAAAVARAEADAADPASTGSKLMEDLRDYLRGEFFDDLRRRVLSYLDELQVQQQRELPGGVVVEHPDPRSKPVNPDGSDSSEDEDADGPVARARKAEQLRRHLEQKWSFPDIPGRRSAPGAVDLEFMRALIQIFQLEECLEDQVMALRDRMCQKISVSSFNLGLAFENPCFPLILRDVTCPWCCVATHVDVMSHPTRGPGLWICPNCDRLYDRDGMQARLVGLLESVVQAWQSQEITCRKCRRLKTSRLQTFCECFGRFEERFSAVDFQMILRVLRTLVAPHDLPWLSEMLDFHEKLMA